MRFHSLFHRYAAPVALAIALVTTVTSCRDVFQPESPVMRSTVAYIAGGANTQGPPAFYFLPPLGSQPAGQRLLDDAADPTVEICEWADGHCLASPVASFTGASLRADGAFAANWDTHSARAGAMYRIRVSIKAAELGHADVAVVASPRQSGDVAVVRGQTLPIKFVIQRGAIGVMSTAGGILSLADNAVRLTFATGAISELLAISAIPATSPDPGVVGGTFYQFGPSPITFAAPVTLDLQYPAALPRGVRASRLGLCRVTDAACIPLEGNTVDQAARRVRATVASFSEFGVTEFPEGCYGAWKDGVYGFWLHANSGDIPLPTYCAAWSPDGSRYAYTKSEERYCAPNELHIATIDGAVDLKIAGDKTAPTDCDQFNMRAKDARFPQFSPDGTKILFGAWAQPAVINADGSGPIQYFESLGFTTCCFWDTNWGAQRWHPDSRRIVFRGFHDPTGTEAYRGLNSAIRIMNIDGTGLQTLVATSHYDDFSYSADGTKFAFGADWAEQLTGSGLYMMDADGSHLNLLLPGIRDFQWAPGVGDNRILFLQKCVEVYGDCSAEQARPPGLYLINATGSGLTALPTPAGCSQINEFQWSPTGTRVYVRGYCDGGYKAYLMNSDGTGVQPFLPPWNPEGWNWRP